MTDQQRKNWNEYIKAYKKRNPDKTLRYKLTSAERFLLNHGYRVIKPDEADQNEIKGKEVNS